MPVLIFGLRDIVVNVHRFLFDIIIMVDVNAVFDYCLTFQVFHYNNLRNEVFLLF